MFGSNSPERSIHFIQTSIRTEQPEAPGVLKPKARKRSPKPLKKSMASGDDIHIYGENLRLLSTSMMFDP
jgi:hypothetical protein